MTRKDSDTAEGTLTRGKAIPSALTRERQKEGRLGDQDKLGSVEKHEARKTASLSSLHAGILVLAAISSVR